MKGYSHYTQSVFTLAARYAHTRKTGASHMVVSAIIEHWDQLGRATQLKIQREAANEATENLEDWAMLQALPVDEPNEPQYVHCSKCRSVRNPAMFPECPGCSAHLRAGPCHE